jgi:NAD(P)-dependent dehydrogenase (short-subunit alcohol dehydrogenase family)
MRTYLDKAWRRAKKPFAIPLGPVQMLVSLRRSIQVSSNKKRRALHNGAHIGHAIVGHPEIAPTLAQGFERKSVSPASEVAVIVGVGPGFGYGLAERLSVAGFKVALASRNAERLDPLVAQLRATNPWIRAYGCDATHEDSVGDMFRHAVADFGPPTLVVYAVQEGARERFLDTDPVALETAWRSNCLGAFIIAREAARRMVERHQGTIVLVGATSGLIGRAGYVNFAVGKFGLRALAQVAARELGPQGIHVAHLIVDAEIAESGTQDSSQPYMKAGDISEVLYQLHLQPRSAWTHELDARPFDERFWEHC